MHLERNSKGAWSKLGLGGSLLVALFVLNLHAQTNPQVSGGALEEMVLEFTTMKPQLTGSAAQKLKRMVSKFASIDAISLVVEEDGSYLEFLCEERVRHVKAVLTSWGVPPTRITARCPPSRVFGQGVLSSSPSSLSIQGASIAILAQLEAAPREEEKVQPKANSKVNSQVNSQVNLHFSSRAKAKDEPAVQQQLSKPPTPVDLNAAKQQSTPSERALKANSVEPEASAGQAPKHAVVLRQEPELQRPWTPEAFTVARPQEGISKPRAPTKIPKGGLVHVFLEELAQSEGWTFLWYPSVSWKTIADIDLSVYPSAELAVVELVSLLRSEGKPIQLRLSTGNKVMEVLSTEVVND